MGELAIRKMGAVQGMLDDPTHDSLTTPELIVTTALIQKIDNNVPFSWTSLPTETREQKIKAWQAGSNPENDIEDIVHPKSFACVNVVISLINFTNADGERITGPKVTMISKDGKFVSVIARIWCEQFIEMMRTFGLPPWEPAFNISAKRQKGNGPNNFYTLHLQQ